MSNQTSDIETKVRELAKLSILSNRISEVHEKNLKAYPFIFFNGVKEANVDYDLERGGKNNVTFSLTLVENADNPSMEKRYEALDTSIKNLFWKEVSIAVVIGGKTVFDSGKKE
jgi:hypothetical protein